MPIQPPTIPTTLKPSPILRNCHTKTTNNINLPILQLQSRKYATLEDKYLLKMNLLHNNRKKDGQDCSLTTLLSHAQQKHSLISYIKSIKQKGSH